jgi:hypothetical protein
MLLAHSARRLLCRIEDDRHPGPGIGVLTSSCETRKRAHEVSLGATQPACRSTGDRASCPAR